MAIDWNCECSCCQERNQIVRDLMAEYQGIKEADEKRIKELEEEINRERERADAWVRAVVALAREFNGHDYYADGDGSRAWRHIVEKVRRIQELKAEAEKDKRIKELEAEVEQLKKRIHHMVAACGNPDSGEALRNVIAIGLEGE